MDTETAGTLEFIRRTKTTDDYYQEYPERIRFSLIKEEVKKIRTIQGKIKEINDEFPSFYSLEMFDPIGIVWEESSGDAEWTESDIRMETVSVVFTTGHFYVKAYVRHTNVEVESEPVLYSELS